MKDIEKLLSPVLSCVRNSAGATPLGSPRPPAFSLDWLQQRRGPGAGPELTLGSGVWAAGTRTSRACLCLVTLSSMGTVALLPCRWALCVGG